MYSVGVVSFVSAGRTGLVVSEGINTIAGRWSRITENKCLMFFTKEQADLLTFVISGTYNLERLLDYDELN